MSNNRKQLVFIELIIVLFFFSIAATINVKLFVAAHKTSQQSVDKTGALLCAQNVTEQILATSDPSQLPQLATAHTAGLVWYFDQNWQQTTQAQQTYAAVVTIHKNATDNGDLYDITVCVTQKNTEVLCDIQTKQYYPMGRLQ